MKLTPIYPAHIKPVRKGVYKVIASASCDYFTGFAKWNGRLWGWSEPTIALAESATHPEAATQNKRWQGLTTKDGK